METLNPTPQDGLRPAEFDHLLGVGPEQHLTVEDAAIRSVDPGSTSRARAEIERNVKAGEIRRIYGEQEHEQPK